MRFNGICIITKNLPRLRDFYNQLLQTNEDGDVFVGFPTDDGSSFSLFAEEAIENMAPGSMENYGYGGYTIEFEVKDVDKEYERLKDIGVTFVKPPTTQPWGRRSVWFRDPDGNIINFYASL